VDVGTDEDGLAVLEDLVVSSDANAGEVLLGVELARHLDGLLDDVVDGAQGDLDTEEVAQKFDDASERAVTDERESEDKLTQPCPRDGEMEQDGCIRRRRRREGPL
jgi:hypothetical protein